MIVYRGQIKWLNYAVNEPFTAIFPYDTMGMGDPIHYYWQWTSPKTNALAHSIVNKVDYMSEDGKFHFTCPDPEDRYLHFTFTVESEGSFLLARMIRDDRKISEEMKLERIYSPVKEPGPLTICRPQPRIYAQQIQFGERDPEQFLILLPMAFGRDKPIIGLWQWPLDQNGEKGSEGRIITTQGQPPESTSTAEKDAACFSFHITGYDFNCEATDDLRELKVQVQATDGSFDKAYPLDFQPVFGREGRRKPRAIIDRTTIVDNDTTDIVVSTFKSSLAEGNSQTSVGLGLLSTSAGFIPMAAVPNPVSWAITTVALVLTAISVVELKLAAGPVRTRILAPDDTASNTSKGGFFFSSNNLSLVKISVESSDANSDLRISTGHTGELGDVRLKVKSSKLITWDPPVKVSLPGVFFIEIYRLISIWGLMICKSGKDVEKESNLRPHQYALSVTNEGSVKQHRIDTGHSPTNKDDEFSFDPKSTFVITQALWGEFKSSKVGRFRIIPLPTGQVLVKMKHATIKDSSLFGQSTFLGWRINSNWRLIDKVVSNPGYFAYSLVNDVLRGWQAHEKVSFQYHEENVVYFLVDINMLNTKQFMVARHTL